MPAILEANNRNKYYGYAVAFNVLAEPVSESRNVKGVSSPAVSPAHHSSTAIALVIL